MTHMTSDASVPVERVMALLDTSTPDPERVSCMAAAIRDARQVVGRNSETGRLDRPEFGATWAGALTYLIFAEQIGSCFHPIGDDFHKRRRGHPLGDALQWFAGFDSDEAGVLSRLRDRLAHDYTLLDRSGKDTFALHGSAHEPVVRRHGVTTLVGLPALAIRIEHLHLQVLLAADEGWLGCHHKGGIDEVDRRFWMAVVSTG